MDTLLNADNFAGNGEIPGLSGGRGGPGNEGISPFYQGIGSGRAELNMAFPHGQPCTHLFCQEIAPMSRGPGIASCRYDDEEELSPRNTGGEGLAVADHGIVVVGANANYQQYSTGACTALTSTPNNAVAGEYTLAAPASGQLATTGVIPGTTYVLGAGGLSQNRWKDVLRLVYTGCGQNDGKCAPTIPRATRCSSTVRTNLLNNYGRLFNGSNCGGPGNCTQLRKAYRPDDASDMAPCS
jgi:hypothetical protein